MLTNYIRLTLQGEGAYQTSKPVLSSWLFSVQTTSKTGGGKFNFMTLGDDGERLQN